VRSRSLVWAALALAGCSDRASSETPTREPVPQRRVIEPPTTADMKPLPPYAIRADSVGPYKLGAPLLEQVPSARRVRLEIPGILHQSLIRADDDQVLLGGEPTLAGEQVQSVAVVAAEIARTESGVHVGSKRDDVVRAFGPLVDEPDHALDPRLAIVPGMRNLRFIFDEDKTVAAMVVVADPRRPPRVAGTPVPAGSGGQIGPVMEPRQPTCPRPTAVTDGTFGACLTGTGELVELDGDELTVRAPDGERTLATVLHVPNLVFAVPLRDPVDGRDDLVVITRVDDAQQRTWSLTAYRLEQRKRTFAVERETLLYSLSSNETRWIGADLRDVDLYLELTSRADGIEVGGLLTTRTSQKIRDVVVLSKVVAARRRAKTVPAESGDAGVDTPGSVRNNPAVPKP